MHNDKIDFQYQHIQKQLSKLIHTGDCIMTAISDFTTAQNAYYDQIDASVVGLSDDLTQLANEVKKLQASLGSGNLSQEDQASLNAVGTRTKNIADRVSALNALNPPTPTTPANPGDPINPPTTPADPGDQTNPVRPGDQETNPPINPAPGDTPVNPIRG